MTYEMAMLMNWLLVAVGLLSSDVISDLFDGGSSEPVADEPEEAPLEEVGVFISLPTSADTYVGTSAGDTIFGQAGDDSLDGAGGDDIIEGNTGADTILGGTGQDTLAGGDGTDAIFGGAGNDVLSSDNSAASADFSRGEAEVLDGGAGDDQIYFSSGDVATGGSGADSFGLVQSGPEIAQITDFEVGADDLVIYVEGLDALPEPPDLTYSTNEDAATTTVALDGAVVLRLDGVFSEEELAITLADDDTIEFVAKTADAA